MRQIRWPKKEKNKFWNLAKVRRFSVEYLVEQNSIEKQRSNFAKLNFRQKIRNQKKEFKRNAVRVIGSRNEKVFSPNLYFRFLISLSRTVLELIRAIEFNITRAEVMV